MIRRYRRLPRRLRKRVPSRHRRGVLLLVILSILVLFVLIAVTFVLTSNQAASSSSSASKAEEHRPDPEALLHAAMLQLLVGTENQNSALWGQELLGDMYGGWVEGSVSGGASATSGSGSQFVQFSSSEDLGPSDYLRGCVLTMLDGPAAGESTRIVYTSGSTVGVMAFRTPDANGDAAMPADGNRFVINGRPFSGTGLGFNESGATTSQLTAYDVNLSTLARELKTNQLKDLESADGGLNEEYDAPDFQNLFLSMILPDDDNTIRSLAPGGGNIDLRIIPSYHRPLLVANETDAKILRRRMLRPLPQDHNLGVVGSNYFDFSGKMVNANGQAEDGQYDVDCDNDGKRESVWLDLGFPVMTARDGRRYKPLIAFLVKGLDGRVNVNTAGTMALEDGLQAASGQFASGTGNSSTAADLSRGCGFGPAYVDPFKLSCLANTTIITDRYSGDIGEDATDVLIGIQHYAAPNSVDLPSGNSTQNNRWTGPPDFHERLALGIATDGFPRYDSQGPEQLTRSPYRLNLSRFARRGVPLNNSASAASNPPDTTYTPAELEAILRCYDKDANKLPVRLREVISSDQLRNARRMITTDSYDVPTPLETFAYSVRELARRKVASDPDAWMANNLPWELLAGLRMDLNRPFGIGRPGTNGIVDDPADSLSPIVSLPVGIGQKEDVTFDLTNGVTDGNDADLNGDGTANTPLDKQLYPRVLYARHLYCLAMLLADDGATPKTLAQWAVNVVDFRDRDSIMTRFAFDTNPFDGWDTPPASDKDNVVWGVEKPELLVTETSAFHDIRVQEVDPATGSAYDKDGKPVDPNTAMPRQIRRPSGNLIVELYHPRNPLDQRPRELYSGTEGLQLGKLDSTGNSAIWRLAISAAGPSSLGNSITLQPTQIDRVAYFTTKAPSQDDLKGTALRFVAAQEPKALPPNCYAVVAPGEWGDGKTSTVYFGWRTPSDTEKTDSWNPSDKEKTATKVPGVLTLDNSPPNEDPGAKLEKPSVPPPGAIKPNVAVIMKAAGENKKVTRFSLSEPASGYENLAGDGDIFEDFYERETVKTAMPFDTTDEPSKVGHHEDYRYVYLQRLADPTHAWHETANPYVIVDVGFSDLETYNGEAPESTPDEIDPDNRFATRRRGGNSEDVWNWSEWTTAGMGDPKSDPLMDSSLGFLNKELGSILTNVSEYGGYSDKGDPQKAFPWLPFNDRPFINPYELLLVPGRDCKNVLFAHNVPTTTAVTSGNTFNPDADFKHTAYRGFFDDATSFHMYRLFDYVGVRSPFVRTENWLRNANGLAGYRYAPPYNRVSEYRDPGRVNLNTICDYEVFQALVPGEKNPQVLWNQFVKSRHTPPPKPNPPLGNTTPKTFFPGVFRSYAGYDLVPEPTLQPNSELDTGLLRRRPDGEFLFGGTSTQPYDNATRNPYFRFQPIMRLANTTTCRSNVYAVWITVGFFEVSSVDANDNALSVNEVYKDGYRLIRELGSDTGDVVRHRAFYIIDRTIPVAYQRGRTNNAHNCVLISRMIE